METSESFEFGRTLEAALRRGNLVPVRDWMRYMRNCAILM